MSNFKTVSERLITLTWNDVEPKLKAYVASGAAVAAAEGILTAYNVPVPGFVDGLLVLAAGAVAGYIKKTAVRIPPPAAKVPLPTPVDVLPETQS